MHFPSLFVAVVYISAYILLLFGAISLASGLYYLVELAEEYTVLTKRIITNIIYAELCLHVLLWGYEGMWFLPNFVGFLSHLTYLFLLQKFPYIEPASPRFLVALAMFAGDNFVWYTSFHADPEFFYRYSVGPMAATLFFYFLAVWLVPLGFFVSLTVNDSVLPNSNMGININMNMNGNGHHASIAGDEKSKNKKSSNNVLVYSWNLVKRNVMAAVGSNSSGDILSSAPNARYR